MSVLRLKLRPYYYSLVSNLLYTFIILLNRTTDIRFVNPGMFRTLRHRKLKPIYTVWHQATFPLLYFYRDRECASFTSDGRKGEILTRCAQKLGYIPVQVPYRANITESAAAFRQMLKLLKNVDDSACVVDGPAGPIFQIKPGVFHLAAMTGRVIVPLSVRFERKIQLGWRWDKYILPLPWSRVWITIGEPIAVSRESLETHFDALNEKLVSALHGTATPRL